MGNRSANNRRLVSARRASACLRPSAAIDIRVLPGSAAAREAGSARAQSMVAAAQAAAQGATQAAAQGAATTSERSACAADVKSNVRRTRSASGTIKNGASGNRKDGFVTPATRKSAGLHGPKLPPNKATLLGDEKTKAEKKTDMGDEKTKAEKKTDICADEDWSDDWGGAADVEELVAHLKVRECEFHPDFRYLDTLADFSNDPQQEALPNWLLRLQLLFWLQELAVNRLMKRQTLHLAVGMLDRCMAVISRELQTPNPKRSDLAQKLANLTTANRGRQFDDKWFINTFLLKHRYQLLGAVCLWIAAKVEESFTYDPKEDFVLPSHRVFTVDDMLQMEQYVIQILGGRFNSSTAPDALRLLLQATKRAAKEDDLSATNLAVLDALFWDMVTLMDLAVLDPQSLLHYPTAIAASVLIVCLRRTSDQQSEKLTRRVLHFSNYRPATLEPCVSWISDLSDLLTKIGEGVQLPEPSWSVEDQLVHAQSIDIIKTAVQQRTQPRAQPSQSKTAAMRARPRSPLVNDPAPQLSAHPSSPPSSCAQPPSPCAQPPSPCAQPPSPCAQAPSPCAQAPSPPSPFDGDRGPQPLPVPMLITL